MSTPPAPRFCRHCGNALPSPPPNWCGACGGEIMPRTAGEIVPRSSAGAKTVRLSNARVEQSVVGGTVRLPSSGAVPPGMWAEQHPPGPADVVALYVPLRAVVGGWSGLLGQGWERDELHPARKHKTTHIYRFETRRSWFAAPGCAQGLQLDVRIAAEAEADEGKSRRGFRYRETHDAPMEVVEARWLNPATGQLASDPLPEIQLMAPPRIPRISDYKGEQIAELSADEGLEWTATSLIGQQLHLLHTSQQRTPVGRGLPLVEIEEAKGFLARLLRRPQLKPQHRVMVQRPFSLLWSEWPKLHEAIIREAKGLGLDMETDAVVEWWLDRQSFDSVVFEQAEELYGHRRTIIVFRRNQIAHIRA